MRYPLAVFGGWTLYAVVASYALFAWRSQAGEPTPPFLGLLHYWLILSWLWALLTFPIVALARRVPVTAATWPIRVPVHLAFALITHVVHAVSFWAVHPIVGRGPRPPMPGSLFGTLFIDLFLYVALVAVVHAFDAQRQAARLRTELLEAELSLLRMQLQPHFLFNTLNAVSELIRIDPARAERSLVRLGDLLRWSLQTARLQEVALRDELAALEHYVEIQRLRHGDALTIRIDADADTLGLATPSLLLQPLVENAIRHGVRGRAAGIVTVRARRDGDRLALRIADDGRGIGSTIREGTGLRTTRARLQGLYGAEHDLRFDAAPGGGTVVDVRLPGRPAASGTNGGPAA